MTNDNVRLFPHDRLLAATLLRLIPAEVFPNHLTIVRLCLIPVVLFFLIVEQWFAAVVVFLFAALTDALDGSLARTRRQITLWGTMADPVADKLLIGSVVVVFVAEEVNVWFAVMIVLIELAIALGAYYRHRKGVHGSANEFGKIKMVLQVIGVTMLLVAKIIGLPLAVDFAVGTLTLAMVFAIVSLLTYGI